MIRWYPILLGAILLATAAPAAADGYSIQVGAFRYEANAKDFAASFAASGIPVYIDPGEAIFRVRLGEFRTLTEARSRGEILQREGRVPGFVIVQRVASAAGGAAATLAFPSPPIRGAAAAGPAAAATDPVSTPAPESYLQPQEEDCTIGKRVAETGLKFQGIPYVYGGSTIFGFDCSGFTQAMYYLAGITLPRVAADQYGAGRPIDKDHLKPGDLVFFAKGRAIDHVGIYAGDNAFIHAPHTGDTIKISSLADNYYTTHYAGACRPY